MHSRPWRGCVHSGDRLSSVTGTVIKPFLRRAATVAGATAALLASTVLLAGPASADVPVGWAPEPEIDRLFVLGFLVGVPVLLFVLIVAMVYLPGVARGERVAPGATGPEDQWLGGRRNAGEIAMAAAGPASGTAGSTAGSPGGSTAEPRALGETDGGASARW